MRGSTQHAAVGSVDGVESRSARATAWATYAHAQARSSVDRRLEMRRCRVLSQVVVSIGVPFAWVVQ